jgi:glycosyltransferase involved in cell wall biosynthesis
MAASNGVARAPRVSVGLPVFNGERYVGAAIESVLGQSFSDLELIISDNASTDATEDVCRAYAKRDGRVRYFRNAKNLGAARNFNSTFEHSSGEFFKWAAHDDIIAPDFLARCVAALDGDPSSVLCCSQIKIIDAAGNVIEDYVSELANVAAAEPARRFADLVLVDHPCYELCGLVRADVLRKTSLLGGYIASDRVLLAELGLYGRFHTIPACLFFSRDHAERALRSAPFHLRAEWFDTENRGRRVFPHWRFFSEYFGCVRRVPLDRSQRLRCYLSLLRWPGFNLNWARMASDLFSAYFPKSLPMMLSVKERLAKPSSTSARHPRVHS